MDVNRVIELQNMFTKAVNIAKKENKYEYNEEITDEMFCEYLKQAYPSITKNKNSKSIIQRLLSVEFNN